MIEILKNKMTPESILTAGFGVEREGLRVTPQGKLALTPHPPVFGDKLKNPYITTDFSESQVELVTPVCYSVTETYDFLEALTDIVINEIDGDEELFWPYSMPCDIPEDKNIPISTYQGESGKKAREYREKLMAKYGGKRQLISGIHYNFSFSDDFLEILWKESGSELTYKDFKDKIYLKVLRNYLRYRWLIIYLMGCTPGLHESYIKKCLDCMEKNGHQTFLSQGGTSARNGNCSGYKNEIDLYPDYSSVSGFIGSIKEFISRKNISEAKELYAQIRLKPKDFANVLGSLERDGIQYLEIRTIDLNPFDKCGIAKVDLEFLNIFMLFLLLEGEEFFETWQQEALINEVAVAEHGLESDLELLDKQHWTLKTAWAEDVLGKMAEINEYLNLNQDHCIEVMLNRVKNPQTTYAYRLKELMTEKGYIRTNLELANKYKSESVKEHYHLKGFENWELSTQILIKEALTRGIKVTPVDASENIIALEKDGHKEYVKQATKTSADTYITPLLMENKVVTKMILKENGIPVPKGEEFFSFEEASVKLPKYVGKKVVIKPKSTNFGLGICIYNNGGSFDELLEGARIAFEHDNTILIEEYIAGLEYRFLTMGDDVVAVLHRRPANVVGDGILTIQELIDIKNQHPYRGDGHTSPLKKIELDDQSQMFLKKQGISVLSVPKPGEVVYLRGNSNISTGGDSIDYTEEMHPYFSKIALAAARAFDAKFCGIDIIIEDYKNPKSAYGIIELNFNPAIMMHAYPFEGKERRLGYNILKTIGLAE
ncbi:bifunctional glutamate--cysteine ligase GshA/glutathione synthetase GshB [Acetobacterium paludosum]|uniref:Glutathione biosynthesis bifunctional protein GshAB n=1 Tax=Acetobacterium paludosum TaxID=52693 RepID=A0A923KWY0_9FIRM|nr:bifunctional glutamate--cysteine ligase GshA/glutathione synthetase GshB [Acetobacterium paludosum]MBC3887706.1 bifunctional glutamate--cysteine ligase GshA/glutathione synthetase GshB [Acetobacterium paludosum]